ncbi:MAG: hypothetical protein LBQ57_03730, partial [Spirochaetales bacterium]|nr:hypothetical protein [Spirochaetales bacterium]
RKKPGFPLQSFGDAKRIYAAIPGAAQGLPVILHGKNWCTLIPAPEIAVKATGAREACRHKFLNITQLRSNCRDGYAPFRTFP